MNSLIGIYTGDNQHHCTVLVVKRVELEIYGTMRVHHSTVGEDTVTAVRNGDILSRREKVVIPVSGVNDMRPWMPYTVDYVLVLVTVIKYVLNIPKISLRILHSNDFLCTMYNREKKL